MSEGDTDNEPRSLRLAAGAVRQRWHRNEEEQLATVRDVFVFGANNLDSCIPGVRRCPWPYLNEHRCRGCENFEPQSSYPFSTTVDTEAHGMFY